MKRRLIVYKILAYTFLGLQIISYLAMTASKEKIPEDQAERIGYYFGLNIFAIISFIFFISIFRLRKKIKKEEDNTKIDSIGSEI